MKRALLIFAFIALTEVADAQDYRSVQTSGIFWSARGERSFELYVVAKPFSAKRHGKIKHFWGGDDPAFKPRSVASSFRLTVDGVPINIPASAIADMGDIALPDAPYGRGDGADFALEWGGGDAAGTYRCTFFFSGTKLIRREVFGYLAKEPSEVKNFK